MTLHRKNQQERASFSGYECTSESGKTTRNTQHTTARTVLYRRLSYCVDFIFSASPKLTILIVRGHDTASQHQQQYFTVFTSRDYHSLFYFLCALGGEPDRRQVCRVDFFVFVFLASAASPKNRKLVPDRSDKHSWHHFFFLIQRPRITKHVL